MDTLPNTSNYYAGRPTKYTPELLRKAQDYLESYQDDGDIVPIVAGLCQILDINKDTAYTWAKDKNKRAFSVVMQRIACQQERDLLNGSLTNKLNPSISKLMLLKHGYTDNPQQDQGVSVTVDRTCGRTVIKKGKDTVTINDGKTIDGGVG